MTLSLRATLLSLFIGLLGGLSALKVHAQAPQAPEIAARAYLLVDVTAQQVLAELDADKPIEPASLTKLMTAWLAHVHRPQNASARGRPHQRHDRAVG
jgi:D-alanyl-D-alanine carboxypeptidase